MRIISCMLLAAVVSGNAAGQNPDWDVPYQPSLLEWSVVKTNIDTTDVLNRMFIQRGENVRLWLTAMRGTVGLCINYDSQMPENITKEEFEAFKEWATNSVIVSLDRQFLTHALLMRKNGQDLPKVLDEFIDNYPWVQNALRGFLNGEAIMFSEEGDEYLEAKRLYKLKVHYVPLTRKP